MIRFDDVVFRYPAVEGPAVAGLSFELASGQLLAVLGSNGSGKSTLAKLANGLLLPVSGSVTVDGLSTGDGQSGWDIRRRVGVVFQNPDNQIVATVVEEDAAFALENLGVAPEEIRRRVDHALALVGLTGLERREPHLLSGGQKQRLAIAGAIAMDPEYLVLDEPTAMLDPVGRRDVLRIVSSLRDQGRGVIHVTHHLADIASADRVLVLRDGMQAFLGRPEELLVSPGLVEQLGLAMPPIARLSQSLRMRGVSLPVTALSPERVAGALCL